MNGAVDELRPTRCGVEKTPWPLCVVTPRAARRTYARMHYRKRVRSVDANMCAKNIVCRARTAPTATQEKTHAPLALLSTFCTHLTHDIIFHGFFEIGVCLLGL